MLGQDAGPGLDRHQNQLVEPRPFGIKKACIGEVGQRLAAAQPECLAQGGGCVRGLARLGQPAALRHQLLEADDVDLIGPGGQGIAGFGGEDRGRSEGAAQLADLGLQRVGRVGRLPVAPQHVDQPVGADRLARAQGEQGQQGPLLGPADRYRHARVFGFELAEQPDLREATIGPASAPRQRQAQACHSIMPGTRRSAGGVLRAAWSAC